MVPIFGVEGKFDLIFSITSHQLWIYRIRPSSLLALILRHIVLTCEYLIHVFLSDLHLLIILLDNERMVHQVLVSFPLKLVMLETLCQEEDALESQDFFARVTKIVATDLDLVLELGSIFGMERSLSVEQLK